MCQDLNCFEAVGQEKSMAAHQDLLHTSIRPGSVRRDFIQKISFTPHLLPKSSPAEPGLDLVKDVG